MSTGKQRRGRPSSRNSLAAPSANSLNALSSRIGRRGGAQKASLKLPSEPDPERDIYVVESLIKVRESEGPEDERHFFVKWLNYPTSQNSWEPESNLSRDLVVQWEREHGNTNLNRQNVISLSSSERSASRVSSSNEGEVSAIKGSAKGKKRLLPTSPKVQTTAPPKSRDKTPPPSAQNEAQKPSVSKEKTTTAGLSAANRAKLLEVVGSIKPAKILAVYRESEGELCYLIERSCASVENTIPEGRQGFNDRMQIVSSQVFDQLWPDNALDYYEGQVQSTICLEGLDTVPISTTRGGGDGLAAAMAGAKIRDNKDDKDNEGDDEKEDKDESEEDEYEVEGVVDVMTKGGKRLYLLKWVGYPNSENTWEREDNLNCPNLLNKFWESRPEADPRKKKKVAEGGNSKNEKQTAVLPVAKKPQKLLGFHLEGAKTPSEPDNLQSSIDRWRFVVKWQGDSTPEVVPYAEARTKWPLTVLKFFQKYLDG